MSRRYTLLLVEDDVAVREALTNLLTAENYRVLSVGSSREAILAFDGGRIDVVVLDLNLGKEDGWQAFEALKKLNSRLPILVTSAQPARFVHAYARHAWGIVEKPFEVPILLNLIRSATEYPPSVPSLKKRLSAAALVFFAACLSLTTLADSVFKITSLQIQNGIATVTWQGGGALNQLQRQTTLNGSWENVGAATSGSTATDVVTGPSAFYRVVSSSVASRPGPGARQWAKVGVVTSGGGQARTFGVATDRSGNVIAVGSFRGTVDFGSGSISSSSGSYDVFVVKYDVQGNVVWVKGLGNTWDDGANAVAIDSQNNIIVTGYFGSTVDFGGTLLTATTPLFGTMPDIFVAKYSPSGALLWAKGFGGSNGDTGFGVAVDGANNIFVGGTIASSDALFGSIPLTTAGSSDIVLTKLSSSGGVLWAKRWGGTGSDTARGVAVDRSGDLVVSGQVGAGADLGGGVAASSGIFVAKYSGVDGSYRWAKVLGPGVGNGVATDPTTGNVILTGSFSGSTDFGGGHVLGLGGIFLVAYDGSGNCLWAQTPNYSQFGFSASDMGCAVSVDGSGNIAMSGQVVSSVSFDGNLASYGSGGGIQNSFIWSLTSSGGYRWSNRSIDTYASAANAVAFDTLGHVVTTGIFYSTIDFGGLQFSTPVYTVAPFLVQYSK